MNDALYELLVARRSKPTDMLVRVLVIALIVAVTIFGFPFIGIVALMLSILLAVIAYYFIFPKLSVEFEYILLNHDLQIDAVYNKEKRKPRLSLDIQTAEIIAPSSSPRLQSFHPDKTYDFSSGNPDAKTYSILAPIDQSNICVVIEPDEKMLHHMSQWMGSKMYLD